MTVGEIFAKLSAHMIEGLMTHEQLANYYDFLSLKGYKRLHEYHYLEETCYYRKLCRYYINHFNKLIPDMKVDNPEVIPMSWYQYKREDVDVSTRRNAVRNGVEKWIEWEKETKKLYQESYKELMELGEVAAAKFLCCFIENVDDELKKAERCKLYRSATDYDMTLIEQDQYGMHHKYREKVKSVGEYLC